MEPNNSGPEDHTIKVEIRTPEKAAEIDRKLGIFEWFGEELPIPKTPESTT